VIGRSRIAALASGVVLIALPTTEARADLTFRHVEEHGRWPAGTDTVRVRIEDGQVLIPATLRSLSGQSASGFLALDTGAPFLALRRSVWDQLKVDTLEMHGSYATRVHRPLASVDMGTAQLPDLSVEGVYPDSLFPEEMGLFAPFQLVDRALVLDYADSVWAMVPPHFAFTASDSSSSSEIDVDRQARIRRSRAAYAGILDNACVAVPFRLSQSRILVDARVTEPDQNWRGGPLTLVLDTGASACLLFSEIVTERVHRAPSWPRLTDATIRTMKGMASSELTVLPALQLEGALPPLAVTRVEAEVIDRASLPDVEEQLPEHVHGLLGTNFLDRFRVTLDYRERVLWLRPVAIHVVRAPGGDLVGMRLERRWGHLRVQSVAPSSAAARAGIVFGDVVVSIEGRSMATAEVEGADRLLQGPPGSEVQLIMGRGGMHRVLRLRRGAAH
jgi:predicted aspartyl protease